MKFRVWSVVEEKYINPFIEDIIMLNTGNLAQVFEGKMCLEYENLDSSIFLVENSSGLVDVDGKEIYVGDIIRIRTTDPFEKLQVLERVIFRDGSFCVLDGAPLSVYPILEIKGNIHQNPELLEN